MWVAGAHLKPRKLAQDAVGVAEARGVVQSPLELPASSAQPNHHVFAEAKMLQMLFT